MLYLNYCIKKTILFIFMLTSLAACQQVPTQDVSTNASDYSQITAEELLSLFDKKLMLDGNYLTVSADGSFSGTWNNEPMGGTWKTTTSVVY